MSTELIKKGELSRIQERFVQLTDRDTFERETSFALQIFASNPQLQQCSRDSVMSAILNVANVGLSLNPAKKEAYLLPRWDRRTKSTVCCLEPSYVGLVKLLTDTGSVTSVSAKLVRDGDEFEYQEGTSPRIIHKVKPFNEKAKILGAYAIAQLHNGAVQIEMMGLDQLHEIRGMSESYKSFSDGKIKSCVWVDHEGEMYRKTVIRRLVKYLPRTNQFDKVNHAVALDEMDFGISWNKEDLIHNLINSSTFDDDQKASMERQLSSITNPEADRLISILKDNQIDPIAAGRNYNQTDIKEKLKQHAGQ